MSITLPILNNPITLFTSGGQAYYSLQDGTQGLLSKLVLPSNGTGYLYNDGSGNLTWESAGGGSPAAPNNSIQYNNGGNFAAVTIGDTGEMLCSNGGGGKPAFTYTPGQGASILGLYQTDSSGGNTLSSLGDVNGVGNSTAIVIDDSVQQVTIGTIGGINIVQTSGNQVLIGDANGLGNSTIMNVQDSESIIEFRAVNGVSLPIGTTTSINSITSPIEGQIIWNTTTHRLNVYNGSAWQYIAGTNGN